MDPEQVFINKLPHLPSLYQNLVRAVGEFCEFRVTTSARSITLYGKAHRSFLIIQLRQKWIDIWFPLSRKVEEFPVFRVQQPSKLRYAHFVRLEEPDDIQPVVLDWIAEAYQLTNP